MSNFFNRSLMGRLITLLLLVSIIPMVIVGVISYIISSNSLQDQVFTSNKIFSEQVTMKIDDCFEQRIAILNVLGKKRLFSQNINTLANYPKSSKEYKEAYKKVDDFVVNAVMENYGCYNVVLLDIEGNQVYTANDEWEGFNDWKERDFVQRAIKSGKPDYGKAKVDEYTGCRVIDLGGTLIDTDNNNVVTGFLIVTIHHSVLEDAVNSGREIIGKSAEVYLVDRYYTQITRTAQGSEEDAIHKEIKTQMTEEIIENGIDKDNLEYEWQGIYNGINNTRVLGTGSIVKSGIYRYVLIAEVDEDEAMAGVRKILYSFLGVTGGFLVLATLIAYFMARGIADPIKKVSDLLVKVGDGDLTVGVPLDKRHDEIGTLIHTLGSMVKNLRAQIKEILEGVNTLASSATQISAAVTQFAASSTETAAAVSETTTTIEEVKQTSQNSGEKARYVSESAKKTAGISQTGEDSVIETIERINKIKEQMGSIAESVVNLSEQSQTIGDIISSVDDISEQSNLLAVNASIEAAKAGEHGKGFGVVAREIRSLAEQSKQATGQVRTILNDIQKATSSAVMNIEQGTKAVETGVKQSSKTKEAIRALAESIEESAQAATQISAANQQVFVGVEQVTEAIENIKKESDQNIESIKQVEEATDNLKVLGEKLKQLAEKYKI